MGRLGVKLVVDCWKTVDLQVIHQHSLQYVQEGSLMCPSWRKTVSIDLGKIYLHFNIPILPQIYPFYPSKPYQTIAKAP